MFQYFTEKRFISKLFFIIDMVKNMKMVRPKKIKREIDIIFMKKKMMQIIILN